MNGLPIPKSWTETIPKKFLNDLALLVPAGLPGAEYKFKAFIIKYNEPENKDLTELLSEPLPKDGGKYEVISKSFYQVGNEGIGVLVYYMEVYQDPQAKLLEMGEEKATLAKAQR